MQIGGQHYRSIWRDETGAVAVIDQTQLPHAFAIARLRTLDDAARAIRTMVVRGAPLIGATAAYGLALALQADASDDGMQGAVATLAATRPTAVNLRWALTRIERALAGLPASARADAAFAEAAALCDEDVAVNAAIGEHGLTLIRQHAARKAGGAVNILTHCNAGWLACVDWGTATAPMYKAYDEGLPLHIWVDETRPRNQGAALTAFELGAHGVPHTIIADNAGGHLMQRGEVDMIIVGTDRVAANGDVANKIGTYLKALAARDNDVPFYVACPTSTIDRATPTGDAIPIEERDADEVLRMRGRLVAPGSAGDGEVVTVDIAAPGSPAANPAFDVTPARLVTALVTEHGLRPLSTKYPGC